MPAVCCSALAPCRVPHSIGNKPVQACTHCTHYSLLHAYIHNYHCVCSYSSGVTTVLRLSWWWWEGGRGGGGGLRPGRGEGGGPRIPGTEEG